MTLCTVIQVAVGERAFGVSAGRELLDDRALFEDELDALQYHGGTQQAGRGGLEVGFSALDSFPATVNHKAPTGCAMWPGKGTDLWNGEGRRQSRHYTRGQGAIFYIGNGEDYPPLHTHGYDFRDELIPVAVEMFKGLAEG